MPAHGAAVSMQPLRLAAAGTHAKLWFYPPGFRQAAHSHEQAHVSIIIGGSIREVCGGRDEIGSGSQLRLRPYEITHQVEFGPDGALILAVEVEDVVTRTTASRWIHRDLSVAQRVLLQWILAEGASAETDVGDCIQDLIADIETESLRGSSPVWLTQARERLLDDPATVRIDTLARAAGVHRAHFARAFQHWFRTSPSLLRRRAMLMRAIAAMASGERLAMAAHAGGFADQSHLCRAMRSMMGTTPNHLMHRHSVQHPFNTRRLPPR
ncbi:MAG TPA: AraC family transcriptional regulator [Povalibacter sp.]|nr:AraC family transcriptional regulator [Povalibacter sp.]